MIHLTNETIIKCEYLVNYSSYLLFQIPIIVILKNPKKVCMYHTFRWLNNKVYYIF